MKDNLTEVVFILDRSGSMRGLEEDTIGGYNKFLADQKKVEGDAFISTVFFDNQYEVIHHRENVKDVDFLDSKTYNVRGSTALYDAVGKTIDNLGVILKKTDEALRPSKVLFVIITDGMENSSFKYNHNHIRQMIQHQKDVYNWEFIFLGANIDAEGFAESIGIERELAATYRNNATGVGINYDVMSSMVSELRISKTLPKSLMKKIKDNE